MFSPHKIIMCYIGVVVSGRKVFGRIIDAIKMFYNGPEWQLAGQLLEMFIYGQRCNIVGCFTSENYSGCRLILRKSSQSNSLKISSHITQICLQPSSFM